MNNRLCIMKSYLLLILFISLTAFSTETRGKEISFSIIYIIHGDADYLYHDTSGTGHYADREILDQALDAAEGLDNAEVFIFHQETASRFLFFPQDDSHFYYFNNGKRIKEDSYRRVREDAYFASEINLYEKYRDKDKDSTVKILLYYGHEIPEDNTINPYNITHPEIPFNDSLFVKAVKGLSAGKRFDLTVLSTCNNGTPRMVGLLSPYTRFIIASPENLHLSQMNSLYLKNLKIENYEPSSFAQSFAQNAFNILKKNTLTVITISVYDVDKTKPYVNSLSEKRNDNPKLISAAVINNCDCSTIGKYRKPGMESGVTVFYNPPTFGKNKTKSVHSGWGCKKETNPD